MKPYGSLTERGQVARLRILGRKALERYGVSHHALALMRHHPEPPYSTTFRVAEGAGEQFLLRIYPGHGESDAIRQRVRVESELWWMERLCADLHAPIPRVVRALDGGLTVTVADGSVDRERLCVLTRWVPGRFLRRGLRPLHLWQVGELTARLHTYSETLHVPPGFDRSRVDPADLDLQKDVVHLFTTEWSAEGGALVERAFEMIRATQEELGRGRDVFGLIHADIHQTNYCFHRGRVHLIDFDDSGWGYFLYDLAVTLTQVRRFAGGNALRTALLAGYRSVRELSPQHEAAIDTFCALRELQDTTWCLRERNNPDFGSLGDHVPGGLAQLAVYLGSTRA